MFLSITYCCRYIHKMFWHSLIHIISYAGHVRMFFIPVLSVLFVLCISCLMGTCFFSTRRTSGNKQTMIYHIHTSVVKRTSFRYYYMYSGIYCNRNNYGTTLTKETLLQLQIVDSMTFCLFWNQDQQQGQYWWFHATCRMIKIMIVRAVWIERKYSLLRVVP